MQSKKILLADDDLEDQFIMQDAMNSLNRGDIIIFANGGQELLDLIGSPQHASTNFCLVVLDLNMPKMSGVETLTELKNNDNFKNIPVIIYSTSINPLEKERCLDLGAHSFITKPTSRAGCIEIAKTFLQFCK